MPLLTYNDIPDYLRNSELYRSISESYDTSFYVPQSCLCANSTGVNSVTAFEHILRTLQFWITAHPPRDVLLYLLNNDVCEYKHSHPELWKLWQSFQFAEEFLKIKNIHPHSRMHFAIKNRFSNALIGDLMILGHPIPSNMCTLAVLVNKIDLLYTAVENGCEVGESALLLAAVGARIKMLQYFHRCGILLKPNLAVAAARRGQILSLQFFQEIGVKFDVHTCVAAAAAGHLNCLQYLHKHSAPVDASVVVATAQNDQLACMQYAVQHGAALTEDVPLVACAHDSISCLQYALERRCPINTDATLAAARVGSCRCLRVAQQHGAPWDEEVCAEAALYGHLDCLILARQQGCPWDEKTIANAIWSGHWQCRTYALRNGCNCAAHGIFVICFGHSVLMFSIMIVFSSARDYSIACSLILDGGALCGLMGVYLHLLQRRWPCIDWHTVHRVMINCVAIFAFVYAMYFAYMVLYLVYLLIVLVFLLVKLLSAYALWYLAELFVDFAEAENSVLY